MVKKTADEQSKQKIAEKVVTPTRLYFVPGRGLVKLSSLKSKTKKREEGDG